MYHAHWGSRVLLWRAPVLSLPLCQARPGPPRCARRLARPYRCCASSLLPPCSPPRPVGGVSVVRPSVSGRCAPAGAPRCVPPRGRGGRGGSPSALALAPPPPPPAGPARPPCVLPLPTLVACTGTGRVSFINPSMVSEGPRGRTSAALGLSSADVHHEHGAPGVGKRGPGP